MITIENLAKAIKEEDGEDFDSEELKIIFDEIAGASLKKKKRGSSTQRSIDNLEDEVKGISFTDFMLMMMAK